MLDVGRSALTARSFSPYSAASSSIRGAIMRQGPHHGAQKSTRTGTLDLSTFTSNVESVTTPAFWGPAVRRPRLCQVWVM